MRWPGHADDGCRHAGLAQHPGQRHLRPRRAALRAHRSQCVSHTTVGGFGTLLVIGHEWEPDAKWRRSMELLATEVVPRLRARQIALIEDVGHGLWSALRMHGVGTLLKISRMPARAMGFGELQGFLERGFEAFGQLGDAAPFLTDIRASVVGHTSGQNVKPKNTTLHEPRKAAPSNGWSF